MEATVSNEIRLNNMWYADRSMESYSGKEEMHITHYQPGNIDRATNSREVLNNKEFVFNLLSGFTNGEIIASTTDTRDINKKLTIVFNTEKYGQGITQQGVSGRQYTMSAEEDVVYATYNNERQPVVALTDSYQDVSGRWMVFQDNDFAKDLLNAYPIFNADGKTTDAFYTEMTMTNRQFPTRLSGDKDFRVRYLRPVDIKHIHTGKAYLKDAAEAGYDVLYPADIFNFTDWRQIYPFGAGQSANREKWMDFYGIHEISFNLAEIETDQNQVVEKLNNPNISLLPVRPEESRRTYSTYADFKNAIGYLRYQNNAQTGSYNLYIPFHIVHNWGEVIIRVQVPIVGTFDDEKNIVWLDDEQVKATEVTLNQTTLSLTEVWQTAQLTATVKPSDVTNGDVTWRSTDVTVITVDNKGLVTAVGMGTAQVIATTADGTNLTASCLVTVADEIDGIISVGKDSQCTTDAAIYDLSGRKVTAPKKGHIYIVNGEKVLY